MHLIFSKKESKIFISYRINYHSNSDSIFGDKSLLKRPLTFLI